MVGKHVIKFRASHFVSSSDSELDKCNHVQKVDSNE